MTEEPVTQTLDARADDGHCWQLLCVVPERAQSRLLWLPAMGVAAKHYLPFAQELAASGVAVFVHDWRGNGTSSLRPGRDSDWGYRELLELDLPASEAVIARHLDGIPRVIGGHSLGGQLACCHLAQSPQAAQTLWLVASGAPYWRAFPPRTRWWLPLAYRFLPWFAARRGYLPGHSIGFGGNESRSLIRDWALTALSGRYVPQGVMADLETAMLTLSIETCAVVLAGDWLAPTSSTRFLLSKLASARHRIEVLDARTLGTSADHFSWMKAPGAVTNALLHSN